MDGFSSAINGMTIRLLTEQDDFAELTELLHRAYAALAKRGMRFLASHQDVATTARRAARGECAVAEVGGRIVGTVVFKAPGRSKGTPWYERADVATLGQFAVEPPWQRRGIGSALMDWVEERARAAGATELALDTSEDAAELIRFYAQRGFRFVEFVRWEVVNYRSVVMSKRLA